MQSRIRLFKLMFAGDVSNSQIYVHIKIKKSLDCIRAQ